MSNYCIEKEYEFNPKCDKDITFILRALTAPQRDECISERAINGSVEMTLNKTKLFRYGVKEIRDLTVNGKDIKKSGELLENVIPPIYEEVISKLVANTARKDPKN